MVEKYQLGLLEDKGIIQLGRGKVISKKDIRDNPGDFPVYSSSSQNNGEVGTYGKYMFDDERITWSIDGGGILFYRNNHKYSVTNVCGWLKVLKEDTINCRYLYFTLFEQWQNKIFDYNHKAHPSVVRKEYVIPIPSLSEQERIVGILDTFTASIEKLKDQIAQRRKQFEFYRDQLLDLEGKEEVEWKELKSAMQVLRGKRLTKNLLSEDADYYVFHGGLEPLGKYSNYNREANTVMVINVGASAGTVGYSADKFWSSDGCFAITHCDEILSRFLYYFLQSKTHYLQSQVRHAGIPTLDNAVVEKIRIPILSIEKQQRIVSILDTFEESISNLEAQLEQRQKQYEHYRNQLLTFD